jgi:glycosyltransferase involved in cell wall biosynthesis
MHVFLAVPGPIDTRTGGSIYDRRIADGLRRLGWTVSVLELVGRFPFPAPDEVRAAAAALRAIPSDAIVLADGLAFGALADVVTAEATRLHFVPIVHLPLACDVGLDAETASRLREGERAALRAARAVVVTGPATLPLLDGYDVSAQRLHLVSPGTEQPARSRIPRGHGRPVDLLCVATLNPGKGHEILLRALAQVTGDWRLTCAGSVTRHQQTTNRVQSLARDLGLGDRITLAGELDTRQLDDAYARADVFVLATLRETYGMAVAEALARGLPVVSTRTGAIADIVGEDAGLLVEPGDEAALRDALARVVSDADLRGRLTAGTAAAAARLPTWDDAAGRMAHVLQRLV